MVDISESLGDKLLYSGWDIEERLIVELTLLQGAWEEAPLAVRTILKGHPLDESIYDRGFLESLNSALVREWGMQWTKILAWVQKIVDELLTL